MKQGPQLSVLLETDWTIILELCNINDGYIEFASISKIYGVPFFRKSKARLYRDLELAAVQLANDYKKHLRSIENEKNKIT